MGTIIAVKDLKKYYDDGHIKALDGVNLEVSEGDFIAIVGPSGCGKSTLLNMLGALDVPDSGEVIIDDINLKSERDLASFRRRTVGFIFQLHNLLPSLTAWENIQIPLMELHMPAKKRKARAFELLRQVGLEDRANSLPTKMSGGERQRVAIARALVNNPHILIADEPTGSVDSKNSRRIMDLLKSICRDKYMTLVVVTHDLTISKQADRIVKMLDGRIVTQDTNKEDQKVMLRD